MNTKSSRGFTIVELLIVVVIIAILAAITIVAYNGIQGRAKASAAQSLASQVAKKAEAWNSIVGSYPTYCNFALNHTNAGGTATGIGSAGCTANATPVIGPVEANLENVANIRMNAPTNESSVLYKTCATGAQVQWRDAGVTPIATKYVGLGGASSTAAC